MVNSPMYIASLASWPGKLTRIASMHMHILAADCGDESSFVLATAPVRAVSAV